MSHTHNITEEHCHSYEHSHSHSHGKHGLEHIHSHRNLIGFDEHGIPTVTLKASDHGGESSPEDFTRDYMNAVQEYRKSSLESIQHLTDLMPKSLSVILAFVVPAVRFVIWDLVELHQRHQKVFAVQMQI